MPLTTYTAGQVLTANSLNDNFGTTVALVKTQTIGTAVASVTVTGAFSADYDAYKIIISGGAGSATSVLQLTLGATTTGYYYGGRTDSYAGVGGQASSANGANMYGGEGNAQLVQANIDVINPFAANETSFNTHLGIARTDGYGLLVAGYLNNTTSYTAFTLTPNSGTLTGGIIRVYGYANS
jgi:hypothetical protein